MGRARQLAGRGNNYSIILDSSAADTDIGERLVLNGTDPFIELEDSGLGDNKSLLLLNGTDGDSSDAGSSVNVDGYTGSNNGFSILQEDGTDNPDVEVTSFIDPNDTLIFTSPPKIETNPSFTAFLSANTAVSHATFTKLNLNVVSHDTTNDYDLSNYRYQPSIPGYYRFYAKQYVGSAVDIYAIITMIYKNGVGYQQGGIYSRMQMSGFTNDDMYASTLDVSEVFYMDGDDYVELYVYQASEDGQACSVFGDGLNTTMGGYLIARSNISPQKDNNSRS